MEKEDLTIKEEKLNSQSLSHKGFLILIKYLFHTLGIVYAIGTGLQFIGIDEPIIGCFVHISLIPWLILYMISKIFRFCYVHRLPLYYIGANELITSIDYYIGIPMTLSNLIVIHLLILILLILGYSRYYIRHTT